VSIYQSPPSFFLLFPYDKGKKKKKHCFDGKKIIFFSPAFALFLSVQSEQTPPIILDYFDFKEYPNS
jgi:hypothetical protein